MIVLVFDTLCDRCGVDPSRTTSGSSLFGDGERDAVFMEYGERDQEAFAATTQGRYLDPEQLRRFCAGRKGVRTHDHRFEVTSEGSDHL